MCRATMVEMASGGKETSFAKPKRMKGFIAHLTSAACEWLLIFLLLLDALLSYLLTKFASYCQLQLPCLLCSRLDHILGHEKPELYENLFCSNHKSEISSLVSCHIHGKLADGNKMCDDCLLSVTAKNKRSAKTHRLLVGKLGLVLGGSGSQSPSLSRDLFAGPKGTRQCTCCGKLWKSDQNSPRSIQRKSPGRSVLKPYIPLPCAPRQSRLNHRDSFKKTRDKLSGSEGKSNFQSLSHLGYTELRLNSDSESEFPFSDDDDVSSVFSENFEASNYHMAQITTASSAKCIPSDSNPSKPNYSSSKLMPLPSDQCVEPNVNKQQDMNANCAEEINLRQGNQEPLSSDQPELIPLDQVSSSPIVVNVSNRESESKYSKIACPSQDSLPVPLSELTTLNGTHAQDGTSSEKSAAHVSQTSDAGMVSEKNAKDLEKIDAGEKASDETKPVVCDSAPINPIQDNSSNANKSSAATKEREENGFIIEQPTTEEVDKVEEELEQSPLEISSQGYNASSAVPINHVHSPETQAETSSSNEVQVLRKSSSVESGLGSLDESNITEIEGESSVDRLQRQIEYYKKCMDSLQKELEEERNASAVATNEAMSMITRLQEEKAALQMESLQYLRMMEEQAEYDNDELEKVNDLLTDKEKEIQDLEAELEFYRSNMTVDEPMVQNMHKESLDLKGENVTEQNTCVHNITNTVSKFSGSKNAEVSKVGNEAVTGRITFLEFEEEKEYISQCLKNLEEKVHQICVHSPNVRPEKLEVSKSNKQRASNGEGPQLDGHEETCLSPLKNINTLNGNHVNKDGSAALDSDVCSLNVENNHPTSPGLVISTPRREVELELFALENEISDLNDRLEALEFDHDLLEHLTNSLQNGNDGKQFIKDIAHRLQELRKIGIR
ncbi:myosin-binding protein 3 [Cajanus cajan]|uniref:myosin-binding protein 3 n=1 Tax=Cajanus cajan TaxID=3821 RepID=UPI00098DD3D4|nr:myosin-binding protein 3 [Cajanus cajan]XP_020233355.1 myosin-binding protein 3 [Cajanus cajan]XP_029130248.1 myosin-binding protein 3 [Cajanus cajan]